MRLRKALRDCAMPRMRTSFVSTVIFFAVQPRTDQCRELRSYQLLVAYQAAEPWQTAKRFMSMMSRRRLKPSSQRREWRSSLRALELFLRHHCFERVLQSGGL